MTDDPTIAPLLTAGQTLAELAPPGRDLLNYASDFREIATELNLVGGNLRNAYDFAGVRFGAIADHDRAMAAQAEIEHEARATALRGAKRALIDLMALVSEIEMRQNPIMVLGACNRDPNGEGERCTCAKGTCARERQARGDRR